MHLMSGRRYTAVFAVLAALTLFFGGMLSYKIVSGSVLTANHRGAAAQLPATAHRESVGIQGRAVIQVFRPDGSLRLTWKGHNSLSAPGVNAIAVCASTPQVTPGYTTGCSGLITGMVVAFQSATQFAGPITSAANTLSPSGCTVAPAPQAISWFSCSGWITKGGEAQAPFTGSVVYVQALMSGGGAFDQVLVNPAIAVNQGDRVVAAITFTVS